MTAHIYIIVFKQGGVHKRLINHNRGHLHTVLKEQQQKQPVWVI